MVSDVPVGVFLSGGIDSTAIIGLISKIAERPRTFCVGFEAPGQIDERDFAKTAANMYGATHKDVIITKEDMKRHFSTAIINLDQPSLDGMNTWLVSQAASRHFKVVLSGLGGDEIFAGYDHFKLFSKAHKRYPDGCPNILPYLQILTDFMSGTTKPLYKALIFAFSPAYRFSRYRRLLNDFEMKKYVRTEWTANYRRRLAERQKRWVKEDADDVQQTSYAEINGYLLSTLLRDNDVMSMAHSLELRPVLLDHTLVEFVYALPSRYKLRGNTTKWIFRQAIRDIVSETVMNRTKVGFTLPYKYWMNTVLNERFLNLLYSGTAEAIFTPSYLKSLRSKLKKRSAPENLWAWCILLTWIESNNITF